MGFKVYAPFCSNLKKSLALLQKKKEDPNFAKLFEVYLFFFFSSFIDFASN